MHTHELERPARLQHQGSGRADGYLPGYAPVQVSVAAYEALMDFRNSRLRVDLRVERALVTACTEICLRATGLHNDWYKHSRALADSLQSEPTGNPMRPAPVLIRSKTKGEAAGFAMAWQLAADQRAALAPLVSSAIHIATKDGSLHRELIECLGQLLVWEVKAGFTPVNPHT
jgi:hypothetical protein